jgi:hypothetical protein
MIIFILIARKDEEEKFHYQTRISRLLAGGLFSSSYFFPDGIGR